MAKRERGKGRGGGARGIDKRLVRAPVSFTIGERRRFAVRKRRGEKRKGKRDGKVIRPKVFHGFPDNPVRHRRRTKGKIRRRAGTRMTKKKSRGRRKIKNRIMRVENPLEDGFSTSITGRGGVPRLVVRIPITKKESVGTRR